MLRGEFSLDNEKFDIEKCKRAAAKGNPEAQHSLAICYRFGLFNIEKDDQVFFDLLFKSAEQGLPEGLGLLGDCYRYGIGTEVDERNAFECYEKAAEKDYLNAIASLGDCYLTGLGVSRDERKGIELLEKAADRDFTGAINKLAEYYDNRGKEEKAFMLYKKGKELGDPDSHIMLGLYYANGTGTTKNEQKAFELIQDAAKKYNDCNAFRLLSDFYAQGIGVKANSKKAEYYYQKAVENGYVDPESNCKTLEDYYNEDSSDESTDVAKCPGNAINYNSSKESIQSCIVFIENHREVGCGEGSGFIISSDGYVATCEHVIRDAKKLFIKVTEGNKKKIYKGTLVKLNKETDTAIIKIESGKQFSFIELDDREEAELGEDVVIYGYPLGSRLNDDVYDLNISFAKGNVSSNQVIGGIKKTMLDISAKHGNSGSPIISCKTGKVVGHLEGIVPGQDDWEEVNYMMPVCHLHDLINTEVPEGALESASEEDKNAIQENHSDSKKWLKKLGKGLAIGAGAVVAAAIIASKKGKKESE